MIKVRLRGNDRSGRNKGAASKAGNMRAPAIGSGNLFWNSPWMINSVANAVFFLGSVLLAWAGVMVLQRLPIFPLRTIIVTEAVQQVSAAQIEQVARTMVSGNFLTVNLAAAQRSFEQLPWVRRASLRRQWPDSLVLSFEGQHPVAQWSSLNGEARLVNDLGEVFVAAAPAGMSLSIFSGPEGSSAQMLTRYGEFSAQLATVQRGLVTLRLSPREAWQIKLDDGVVLELGRDQPKTPLAERLARFTTHYAQVKDRLHALSVVDMRYPNGFALKARKS
ncbi:MAG TPA: cell division protein FtsQ/DivIB [Rugosibacter sp.]